ncbi:MAG: HTH domain-containing protein [Chlamydiae bacterium]|nr:HTH domain-containing protein [Chlamydiota bacterium]
MTEKQLHQIQERLLELLTKNSDKLFTIREMQQMLDISSTSGVVRHLVQLEKKGYLKRNPYNSRDYKVLDQSPEKEIAWLNLYGLAQCGKNGTLLDNHPIDRIPIATRLLSFPSLEGFLVKAKGNSMSPRIKEGDLVIAKRTDDFQNGMLAVCVSDGEALIKKIQKDVSSVILISLNSEYPPFLASDDFRIIGEVKGVISREI